MGGLVPYRAGGVCCSSVLSLLSSLSSFGLLPLLFRHRRPPASSFFTIFSSPVLCCDFRLWRTNSYVITTFDKIVFLFPKLCESKWVVVASLSSPLTPGPHFGVGDLSAPALSFPSSTPRCAGRKLRYVRCILFWVNSIFFQRTPQFCMLVYGSVVFLSWIVCLSIKTSLFPPYTVFVCLDHEAPSTKNIPTPPSRVLVTWVWVSWLTVWGGGFFFVLCWVNLIFWGGAGLWGAILCVVLVLFAPHIPTQIFSLIYEFNFVD